MVANYRQPALKWAKAAEDRRTPKRWRVGDGHCVDGVFRRGGYNFEDEYENEDEED